MRRKNPETQAAEKEKLSQEKRWLLMQWRGEVKGHKTLAWSPAQCPLYKLDLAVKGPFEDADEHKQDYNFILGQQWSLKVDHYVSWVNHLARNQNVFMLILGLLQVTETSDKSFRFPVPLCPLTVGFFWLKSTWWTCVLFKYLSLFDHFWLDSEIYSLPRFHNDQTAEIQNLCGL